jgi:signal transduction histidine kinase/CheY-like chemotaxis protein
MGETPVLNKEMVLATAERVAGLGYALWDERKRAYEFVSEQFAGFYGLSPDEYVARYKTYEDEAAWIHPDDRERYASHYTDYLGNPRGCSIELRYRQPGQSVQYVREFLSPIFDDAGQLIQTVIIELQISELKNAEEALRQAQKMEAVGQLTGGIAHDFNNLLAVIMGNLELVPQPGVDAGEVAELIDVAMGAAQRGAELTSRLLAFSRKQATHDESANLLALANGMVDFLFRTLGSRIEFDVKGPKDLWQCRVDRGQFENALLNLALNARDALRSGGRLTIEFSNVEIDEAYDVSETGMNPGNYVRMAVIDTGIGMTPEVVERALEPFFTTKGMGAGSGLGLSMVYGFARQSGGHLVISSELGIGSTVEIFIPRDSGKSTAGALDLSGRDLPRACGECVLLVDDAAVVLMTIARTLESLGYAVKPAGSVGEALSVLDASPQIDLLMTDVMLGEGMSGPELAREVERTRPDLPVLFMSGFHQKKLESSDFVKSEVSFISKPFRKTDIAPALRAAIDGK